MPLRRESCTHGSVACHMLPSKEALLEAVGGVPIVVLGQSLQPDGTPSKVLTNRIALAAELHQLLGGAPLVVSGADVAGVGESEGALMRRLLLATGRVAEGSVLVEEVSRDTLQNALHALPLLQRLRSTEFVLLTSDFHAPRAALLFQGVLAARAGAPMTMHCVGAASGHPDTPPRDPPPWAAPGGGDISSWGFQERCDHERMLLERVMPGWFERHGIPAPPPPRFVEAQGQLAWLQAGGVA